MNRILVIGSAGSGKSTLSRQLSESLHLPVVHLDRYYWQPHWIPTPNEEWDRFVMEASGKDQWIMDGNYTRTLDLRLQRADAVLFLDMPRWLCIYRIVKRRIQYNGKTRPDLNEDCPEKIDWAFFKWVWNYRKRSRTKVIETLESVKDHKVVVMMKTRKQVKEFIKRIKEKGEL